jgi:hypothetical protein
MVMPGDNVSVIIELGAAVALEKVASPSLPNRLRALLYRTGFGLESVT